MQDETRREREAFQEFALELAMVAERAIMPFYQRCTVKRKADGTEVTEADRAAEEALRARIQTEFPEHAILGEEFGESPGRQLRYRWVLDPLDGTASFTLGLPGFGTLIALLEDDEPIVGVVHFPVLGETYYAAKGLGCWWRSATDSEAEPIRVSVADPVRLTDAVASATGTHSTDIQCQPGQTPYRLSGLINAVHKFRFVSDCQQHALVCRGRLHVAFDPVMQPWDIAAIVPCVEEAGGVATTIQGARRRLVYGGSLLTSCSQELHREVIACLQPAE